MSIYKHGSLHIYELVINFPTDKETDTRKHLTKVLKSVAPSLLLNVMLPCICDLIFHRPSKFVWRNASHLVIILGSLLWVVWHYAIHVISLCLCFLTCKMEIIVYLPCRSLGRNTVNVCKVPGTVPGTCVSYISHPYRHHLLLLFLGSCLCCLCGELSPPSQRVTLTSRGAQGGLTRAHDQFLTFPLQLTTLVPTSISALLVGFPPQPLCAAMNSCTWLALS